LTNLRTRHLGSLRKIYRYKIFTAKRVSEAQAEIDATLPGFETLGTTLLLTVLNITCAAGPQQATVREPQWEEKEQGHPPTHRNILSALFSTQPVSPLLGFDDVTLW